MSVTVSACSLLVCGTLLPVSQWWFHTRHGHLEHGLLFGVGAKHRAVRLTMM